MFSFVECGHRVSKHVDGHNSDRYTCENDNKMLQ